MKLRTVLPTAALLTIVSFSGGVAAAESQSAAPAAQPAPAAAAQDSSAGPSGRRSGHNQGTGD